MAVKKQKIPQVGSSSYQSAIVQPVLQYLVTDAQVHNIAKALSVVVTPKQIQDQVDEGDHAVLRRQPGQVPGRPQEVQADRRRRRPAVRADPARAEHRDQAQEPGQGHAQAGRRTTTTPTSRCTRRARPPAGSTTCSCRARRPPSRRTAAARRRQELQGRRQGRDRRQRPRMSRSSFTQGGGDANFDRATFTPEDQRAVPARADGRRVLRVTADAQGQVQARLLLRDPARPPTSSRAASRSRSRPSRPRSCPRCSRSGSRRTCSSRDEAREAAEEDHASTPPGYAPPKTPTPSTARRTDADRAT